MKIIILGIGQVGYNIAKHLISPENQVTIVDHDETRLNAVSDLLDVQPILGHASYPDILEQAGATQADILIAATNIDEVNMVACEIVHSLFEVDTKIARIKQQNYLTEKYKLTLFQPKNLSIDFIISPEIEIAKSISRSIQINGASNVIDLLDTIKLLSVHCLDSAPLINTPLRFLSGLYPSLSITIAAIQRDDQTFIPNANDLILPNDQVHFIIPASQTSEAMAAFGYPEQIRQRVTIVGCGNIGRTLAQEIEQTQPMIQLQIIERNPRCSEVGSRLLKNTEILSGNALNTDILQEAEIQNCDTFISVTNDDNTNILASLLAKNHGAKRVISLLNNTRNSKFVTSLGVDSIVNQNTITVSTVLKAIRQHKIRSLYTIENGIEVIEAYINESSNIVGLSVEDILISGQVFIAVLKRDHEIYIQPEKFIISSHDHLIFVATKSTIHKIEKLVSGRSLYT